MAVVTRLAVGALLPLLVSSGALADEVRKSDVATIEIFAARLDGIPPGVPPESVRVAPDVYVRARSAWDADLLDRIFETMDFSNTPESREAKPLAKVLFSIDLHLKSGRTLTFFGDYYRLYNADYSRFRTFDCDALRMYFEITDPLRMDALYSQLTAKCSTDPRRKRD